MVFQAYLPYKQARGRSDPPASPFGGSFLVETFRLVLRIPLGFHVPPTTTGVGGQFWPKPGISIKKSYKHHINRLEDGLTPPGGQLRTPGGQFWSRLLTFSSFSLKIESFVTFRSKNRHFYQKVLQTPYKPLKHVANPSLYCDQKIAGQMHITVS